MQNVATCVRHWDRPAVGLFPVAGAKFPMSSWMCSHCVIARADRDEVRRRGYRLASSLTTAERKTIGE